MNDPVYQTPVIRPETVPQFAYTNESLLHGAPRAIVLCFHGLNSWILRNDPNDFERLCAQRGVLTIFPYYGPWSWMNLESVRYVDDVVEAAKARTGCPDDAPVISTGGSMGGLSALIYCRYARRTPDACFANCPVCDLPYHATERPDLPRTVYLAFAHYDCGLEVALRMHSPYHQAADMPRIPYHIVHGTADEAVNLDMHSARLVNAMKACGHDVTFRTIEGMTHCALNDYPAEREAYEAAILARANA